MPTHLSIIVYVASPIDYVRYRHTAIYMEYPSTSSESHQTSPPPDLTPPDQVSPPTTTETTEITPTTTPTPTTSSSLLEIIGGNGFFRFHETPNYTLPLPTSTPPSPTAPENNKTLVPNTTTIPTPSLSTTGVGAEIARVIPLPPIADSVSVSTIRTAIICTPINNCGLDWMDWNYQNWVGDVLGRMVKRGIITEATREDAIEKMVDGVLEARDEWMNV